jgi:hypothetical protein
MKLSKMPIDNKLYKHVHHKLETNPKEDKNNRKSLWQEE